MRLFGCGTNIQIQRQILKRSLKML